MNSNNAVLNTLHKTMRSCQKCLDHGYNIVPKAIFTGHPNAQMMTIGQAPGITEVDAERPFNAGSGVRLFKWLAEAGIEEGWFRSTQYMTSVTKCYPGRSSSGSGDRVPSRAEQEMCRAYLDQEIELVNPKLIIPVGKLAINLFYPSKTKLSEVIGTEIEVQGRWIVPLPHPSGASRWHQTESNRDRIAKAIDLIKSHFVALFESETT